MAYGKIIMAASTVIVGLYSATPAMAIPALQLFIEGADYETAAENSNDPETWAKLGTDSFRLWVIADTSETFRIRDVKFVASYADGLSPSLGFSPTTTGGVNGFTDGSTPVDPDGLLNDILPQGSPFEEGGTDAENWSHGGPGDGPDPIGPLDQHGLLTAGRTAVEWNLGLFDLIDSPIADFKPSDPVEAGDNWLPATTSHTGQINVYNMAINGLAPGQQVHFDVYGVAQERVVCTSGETVGCVLNSDGNQYKWVDKYKPGRIATLEYVNAPYSHDARWEQIEIPTPGTAALVLSGLSGIGWFARRRKAA